MSQVTVVDFGAGNMLNVVRAFEWCEADVCIADSPAAIAGAERLVLPGVGAFSDCMSALEERELIDAIKDYVASGRPLLGICVGMQMLFDSSEEFGVHSGLGLIPGRVVPIPTFGANDREHKIPHIGWNELDLTGALSVTDTTPILLQGVTDGEAVYFVHSYMASVADSDDCVATVNYNGVEITAIVKKDNIIGCQFHPEKSGPTGLRMIANFCSAI